MHIGHHSSTNGVSQSAVSQVYFITQYKQDDLIILLKKMFMLNVEY